MGEENIRWLSGLNKNDVGVAGIKGAVLGEMYNLKMPVPSAFVITTGAFELFVREAKIEDKIKEILNKINFDDADDISKRAEQIKNLFVESDFSAKLQAEILEAYDNFNVDYNNLSDSPGALSILKCARESVFVSVRSSVLVDKMSEASFAGQHESFINIKGNNELLDRVKQCMASAFSARSIYYRRMMGYESYAPIAVVVQKMINSDKSGVVFSMHPLKKNKDILIESVFGQGEGLVSGKINPDQFIISRELEIKRESVADKKLAIIRSSGGQTKTIQLTAEKSNQRTLKIHELKQLADIALKLEVHFKSPQDIEFAIENDEIFILQSRSITTIDHKGEEQELDGQLLTEGVAVSAGVVSGVAKLVNASEDFCKVRDGDIMVTTTVDPQFTLLMKKVGGIIASVGGMSSYASIILREMGIPAVFAAENCFDALNDSQEITLDGYKGRVYAGRAQNKKIEIVPVVPTKTKIKVILDLPQFADRASKSNVDEVGLVRIEGIISMAGKHPLEYEKEGKFSDYKKVIKNGLKKIADTFVGKQIWVRTSDIRSDECVNLNGAVKDSEKNPMLGNHGVRFSLGHKEIFKAELGAMKELFDNGYKIGVLLPHIISIEELREVKAILNELEMNVKLGIIVETPACSIIIKDICGEGIDYVLFNLNELTQYTLVVDRNNDSVQNLYNEMSWAVLKQISRVIRECKQQKIETSIYGESVSKKEMIDYLIKQGIDSVSVIPDDAHEVSKIINSIEGGEIAEIKNKVQSGDINKEVRYTEIIPNISVERTKERPISTIEGIDNKDSIKEVLKERDVDETELYETEHKSKEEVVEERSLTETIKDKMSSIFD
jgi:pyruvate, water dikinase